MVVWIVPQFLGLGLLSFQMAELHGRFIDGGDPNVLPGGPSPRTKELFNGPKAGSCFQSIISFKGRDLKFPGCTLLG